MSEQQQPERAAKKASTAKKAPARKTGGRRPATPAAGTSETAAATAAAAKAVPAKATATKATPAKANAAKATAAKAAPAKAAPAQAGAATEVTPAAASAGGAKGRRPARRADSPVTSTGPARIETVPAETPEVAAPVEPAVASAVASAAVESAEDAPAVVDVTKAAEQQPAQVQRAKATVEITAPAKVAVGSVGATGPASAADVERAWQDNALAQVLYHDWEAGTYDEKWSISFDDRCITYARDRFSSLVGPEVLRTEAWPYRRALEIGAGTGFFSLNLKQAGVLDEVHVSDVSAGMVESAQNNARGLGFEVQGAVAGAEQLPYPDGYFDLVIGHAVIHHIPDVETALREVLRVLRPGGRFVIAGEPTRIGDWYARRLGRATWKLTTAVTKLPALRDKWAKSQEELDASSRAAALEAVVDLHTFVPEELRAMAERAGAVEVHTQTEELLAALLGWPVRTFEAAVNPKALGWGWAMFAYTSWQRLSAVDRVLSRALPPKVFYNVGITGTKSF